MTAAAGGRPRLPAPRPVAERARPAGWLRLLARACPWLPQGGQSFAGNLLAFPPENRNGPGRPSPRFRPETVKVPEVAAAAAARGSHGVPSRSRSPYVTSRTRSSRTYGSVGALGGQPARGDPALLGRLLPAEKNDVPLGTASAAQRGASRA